MEKCIAFMLSEKDLIHYFFFPLIQGLLPLRTSPESHLVLIIHAGSGATHQPSLCFGPITFGFEEKGTVMQRSFSVGPEQCL